MTKLKTTGQKLEQNSEQSQIVEQGQVKEIIENDNVAFIEKEQQLMKLAGKIKQRVYNLLEETFT